MSFKNEEFFSRETKIQREFISRWSEWHNLLKEVPRTSETIPDRNSDLHKGKMGTSNGK